MSTWRALRAAPRDSLSRTGWSRTSVSPRIRRAPRRSGHGPVVSKVGRIRTHCVGVGSRLLSQEHNPVIKSVQGDLNPRIHHGKVAGCRATSWTRFTTSSGGWTRTSTLPASAGRSTFELHRNDSSSGGWSRANTCGFRARRPAVRRPRKKFTLTPNPFPQRRGGRME
jgi:hypothetical protein